VENKDKPTHIAYDLRVKDDGIHLTLSMSHRQFLKMLASRGGETLFDYDLLSIPALEHVLKLEKIRLVECLPIVGSEGRRVTMRLTEMGRNVVTLIYQSEV
jgi:hypothetical protein